MRAKEEERLKQESEMMKEAKDKNETEPDWKFQGEGVMIVAKETIRDTMPLCMGLGEDTNQVLLRPCFKEDVPPTLSAGCEREWSS